MEHYAKWLQLVLLWDSKTQIVPLMSHFGLNMFIENNASE